MEVSTRSWSKWLQILSDDEEFIIKTILDKEQVCLKQILHRLCDFLTDNKQTLLPRFFGLYCYKGSGQTIRFVVMNNLLASDLYIDKRFDLKGATKRRKAASVLKDDEFNPTYPQGFKLDAPYVNRFRELVELDCMHLRELGLTNYSLFIAVHDVGWSNNGDLLRVSINNIRFRMRPSQSLGMLGKKTPVQPPRKFEERFMNFVTDKLFRENHQAGSFV
ncbi:unnamed protein product [Lymnaea stagnalis]|uniref:PIPK domain-containing protein n=1 Tax=Lymnaea stagnalis TaxID=6523 RepID=A0AAV2H4Q6_LYMST